MKFDLISTGAGEMSFTEHLEELRHRLMKMLLAVVVGLFISYCFIDTIVSFVTAPAGKLYYLRPAEAFFIYIKVGAVAGCVIATPIIFYQLWAFVMPAMNIKQRLWLLAITVLSLGLFASGILFSYYLVLPLGLAFFTGFDAQGVQAMISMENYIDFLLMLLLPFGLIFELPLVIIVGAGLGIITSNGLQRMRPHVILLSFLLAAILTPPDVISQIMLAVPMLCMYELSLLFIHYILQR